MDFPAAGLSLHQHIRGSRTGDAGGFGVDDPFFCTPACGELAAHAGMVSGPGLIREKRVPSGATHIRTSRDGPLVVALALLDVALGEFARRISGRICALGKLLAEHDLALVQRRAQETESYP